MVLQKVKDIMLNIDYPFVRVGLQLLFNIVGSKMHWLPCRGLAASITPCLHEQPKSVRFLLSDQKRQENFYLSIRFCAIGSNICCSCKQGVRGCYLINSPRKTKTGRIKNRYLTHTPIFGVQILFFEIFCNVRSLAKRGFLALGGQPEARQNYTYELILKGFYLCQRVFQN